MGGLVGREGEKGWACWMELWWPPAQQLSAPGSLQEPTWAAVRCTWAWKTPVCREGSMITTAESKVRVVRPSPCILEHSKDVFNSFLSYQKYKWLMVLPAAGKKELQIHDDVNKSGRISIFLRRFVLYPVNTVSTPKQLRDILAF